MSYPALPDTPTPRLVALAVAEAIEGQPEQWSQSAFAQKIDYVSRAETLCNSVFCIAGWAVALADGASAVYAMGSRDIEERAAELLGVPVDSIEDGGLFSPKPTAIFPAWNGMDKDRQVEVVASYLRNLHPKDPA